jgi:CHAT domain-containing protein
MEIGITITAFVSRYLVAAALLANGLPAMASPTRPSASTAESPRYASPLKAPLPSLPSAVFRPEFYTPAGLRITFTPLPTDKRKGFLDIVLIPLRGDIIGRRVDINTKILASLLRELYEQLGTQQPLKITDSSLPARQLYEIFFAPIAADLRRLGVTTLLISADPSLQAIPFAALTDGIRYFGEQYAFSLTPSIRLTPLQPPETRGQLRTLVAGVSNFPALVPLPLVPQEVRQLRPANPDVYLNSAFSPSLLLDTAADPSIKRIHLATHAEFLPGGPAQSRIYTGTAPLSLAEFSKLRQRRLNAPLDLFTISACRTALGDSQSELGFAGLALQAGARTAVGTLWYIDDVATSAFFVQFYRYLDQGLPKAEALQATRLAFANGVVRLQGNRVVGETGELLTNLSPDQQARINQGMRHPYFWAGITMLGSAW